MYVKLSIVVNLIDDLLDDKGATGDDLTEFLVNESGVSAIVISEWDVEIGKFVASSADSASGIGCQGVKFHDWVCDICIDASINVEAFEHHKSVIRVSFKVFGKGTDFSCLSIVIISVDGLFQADTSVSGTTSATATTVSSATATTTTLALETTTIERRVDGVVVLGFSGCELAGSSDFVGAGSVGEGSSKSENIEDFHSDSNLFEVCCFNLLS